MVRRAYPCLTMSGYPGKWVSMRKRSASLSYRMRISLAMTLCAIIPFLVMVIVSVAAEEPRLVQDTLSQHQQMLEVYSQQLSEGFQDIETKILYVKNNKTIRNYLNRMQTLSISEKLQFASQLQEIHSVIGMNNDKLTLRVYSDLSDYIYGGYCYTMEMLEASYSGNEQHLNAIYELRINETLIVIRGPEQGFQDHVVSVYAKVGGYDGVEHILEISVPIAGMVYPADSKLPNSHIIGLHFEQDNSCQSIVLLGNEEQAQGRLNEYYETGKCKGYYPLVHKLPTNPEGQIVCLLENAYVRELFLSARMPLLVLIVLLIVMVLVCSYFTSVLLTRKVIQFITRIDKELSHEAAQDGTTYDEGKDLADIAQQVRELANRSREQGKQLEAHKLEMKRMELELLQMRFNPHFLYNTLGSIRYQMKDRRIIQSIDSLIAYYRIVLSKGSLVISIESEIQMIQEYLKLQTFAFNLQDISYVYEIDENVKRYTIIKHLLQPIVENALDHGVRGTSGSATITIRARLENENVVFEVEDTGVGMTQEQIAQVTSFPSSSLQVGGYGVYNAIQRIKTYYGQEYGIEYFSEPGKGTLARITIPQKSDAELRQL